MMMGLIGVGLQLVSGLASSGKSESKKDDNPIAKLLDPLGIMSKKDKEENPIEKLLSLFTGGGLLGGSGGGGLSLLG